MKVVLRWLDLVVYLGFLVYAAVTGARMASWYLGLALAVVSAVPWFLARWQLGASFSVAPEARKLVTSGLYSKFRHPVYVFGSVAWFGALLMLLGWSAVIIWLIVVAVEIVRASREDRVLAEAFGAEYTAYRDRTWF